MAKCDCMAHYGIGIQCWSPDGQNPAGEKLYKTIIEWDNLNTGKADKIDGLIVIKHMIQPIGVRIPIRSIIGNDWVDARHMTVTYIEAEE